MADLDTVIRETLMSYRDKLDMTLEMVISDYPEDGILLDEEEGVGKLRAEFGDKPFREFLMFIASNPNEIDVQSADENGHNTLYHLIQTMTPFFMPS